MNQITVATSTWQPALFDDLHISDLPSTLVKPPKRPVRDVPRVTGGLFELVDSVSPDRFRACYHSGASAYYDALGLINAGKDIGVDATIVQPRVIALLRRYTREGGKVFVDSGAYGASQRYETGQSKTPVVDFERVFAVYDAILADQPAACRGNIALVMPDCLKQLELSLDLLQQHREKVRAFIAAGADVIVPIQRGASNAGETVKRVVDILGTRDFTLGVPSSAAAMPIADLATIRGHGRLHILGRGAMTMALFQRVYAYLEFNPNAIVTCDANQLRSHTACISYEHGKQIEAHKDEVWERGQYDETELVQAVRMDHGWMTEKNVRRLAAFYGVTDTRCAAQWVKAHRTGEGALSPLIDAVDPECTLLWSFGIGTVFREDEEKHLSARMRAKAVTAVFMESMATTPSSVC